MESSQEYYTSFQAARSAISNRLDALSSDQNPSQDQAAEISQGLQAERKKLNDATAFLPAYDRRSYESQLRELEARVDELRNKAKGGQAKGSFAFKKKLGASSSKTTASSPSSKEITKPAATEPSVPQVAQAIPSSSLQIASLSRQCFTLSSLSDSISSSTPSDLTITSLEHCVVDLLPLVGNENQDGLRLRAVHIKDVKDSLLFLGYIEGSILAHNLERCVIVAACHQLRVHNSRQTRFHLHVSSNAIIEDCTMLTFAPYPESLPLPSTVRQQPSAHTNTRDFSHLRSTPSPNWCAISDPPDADQRGWVSIRGLVHDPVLQASSGSSDVEEKNSRVSRILKYSLECTHS